MQPKPKPGDVLEVEIFNRTGNQIDSFFKGAVPYANSFGDVPVGKPLLYLNSLMNVSFALNEENFAAKYNVKSGPGWTVYIKWPEAI